MSTIDEAAFRADPASFIAEAAGGGTVVITRADGENVVLLSEHELEGWKETALLMSDPGSAERLLKAKREADARDEREERIAAQTAAA